MTTIEKLRQLQNEEVNNGFLNGQLWNDLEDIIQRLENPSLNIESIQGDFDKCSNSNY